MKRQPRFWIMICTLLLGAFTLVSAQTIAVQKKVVVAGKKGWLGVSIQDITAELKKSMDLKSRDGALVSEVVKKSPADSAGIKEKDVIIQFGSQSVADVADLQKAVGETKPGTKTSVVVLRKGEKKTIDVTVGRQTANSAFAVAKPRVGRFDVFAMSRNAQGMVVRELNEQLAKYFDVTDGAGVLVWEVEKGSAAEKAGVNAGDVVTLIGKKKIKQLRDVSRALGIYDEGEKAEIEVLRKGIRKTLTLDIEESGEGEGLQYWFNEGPLRKRSESMLFDLPKIDVEVPDVEVETALPHLDHLNLQMKEFREQLKEHSNNLRMEIRKNIKPHVVVHVGHTI